MNNILQPVTITFEEPVTLDNKTYKELTFTRKMKGKDMIAADKVIGETMKTYAVCASMAGVPLALFGELNCDDLEAVLLASAPFMPKRAAEAIQKSHQEAA